MLNLNKGDHIYVQYSGYTHHGIYCGNNTVIHYSNNNTQNAKVYRIPLTEFGAKEKRSEIKVKPYDNSDLPDVVIRRAESRLGENGYNLISNNCEHFASWCKTGNHQSKQAEGVIDLIVAIFTNTLIAILTAGLNGIFLKVTLAVLISLMKDVLTNTSPDSPSNKDVLTLDSYSRHAKSVTSVAVNPKNSQMIASASLDHTVKIWSLGDNQIYSLEHSSAVHCVAFSPCGKFLLSSGADKQVRVWKEIKTWQDKPRQFTEIKTLKGHSDIVHCVAFSPNGQMIASASKDCTIKLWSKDSGQEIVTLSGHTKEVRSIAFSPDGHLLASGSADNTIKIWSTITGKELGTLKGHKFPVNSIVFSPNGRLIASGSGDATIKVWAFKNGLKPGDELTLKGHGWSVDAIAFRPGGQYLASGSGDKNIKIWSLETGKEVSTLVGHSERVETLSFSSDGLSLVSGGKDKTLKIWPCSF